MNPLLLFALAGLAMAGCGGRLDPEDGSSRGPLEPSSQGGGSPFHWEEVPSSTGGAGAAAQGSCEAKNTCGSGGAGTGGAPGAAGTSSAGASSAGASATAGASGSAGGSSGGGCGYDASALPEGYPPGGDPYEAGVCPCTRRQPDGSPHCPVGDIQTLTLMIEPKGGLLEFYNIGPDVGFFRLDFPPGAVTEPTAISLSASGAAPIEFQDYTPVLQLEPAGLVLAKSVELRLGYKLPHGDGYTSTNLAIQVAEGDSDCFHPIDEAYLNAGFVQGKLTSLGRLFAGHLKPTNLATCP